MLVFFMHDGMHDDCRAAPPIEQPKPIWVMAEGEETNDYF